MTLDDLIAPAVMVAAAFVILIRMIRSTRRVHLARPELTEPPRRYVLPRPPAARVPAPAVAPPRRVAPPKRRPAPSLEARLFRDRRLSSGARLVLASEFLSRPKALRSRRPF